MLRANLFWTGFSAGFLVLSIFCSATASLFGITVISKSERSLYIKLTPDDVPPRTWVDELYALVAPRNTDSKLRLRLTIAQRMYAALEKLALAKSNTWHLATWAQLEWVRKVLDGDAFGGPIANPFSELRGHSFVRLLMEFNATATSGEKELAAIALREGTELIALLSTVSPETEKPEDLLSTVMDRMRNGKGLLLFTKDFPKYKLIEEDE